MNSRACLVSLVGEEGHDSSHKVLADAEQHHAHRLHQLLDAVAGLHADFMVGVPTAVLKGAGDLPTIRRYCLHEKHCPTVARPTWEGAFRSPLKHLHFSTYGNE